MFTLNRTRKRALSAAMVVACFGTTAAVTLAPAPAFAAAISGAITSVNIVKTTVGPNQNTAIDLTWKVPDGTKAGDTFSMTLPADPFASITSPNFTLIDPATGSVVANAVVSGRTVTFTMTAYAQQHINVSGTATVTAKIAANATLGPQTPTISTTGKDFTDPVTITAGTGQGENTKVGSIGTSGGHPVFDWQILTGAATGAQTMHIVDTPVAPLTIDCSTIVVRVDAYIRTGMVTSCSPTELVIDAVVKDGQVVKVVGTSDFPADATVGTSYKNTAAITIDGTIHHTSKSVQYPDTGGTGTGNQFVEVGDYVFEDVNHDGVQDANDVGIAGVDLTISRSDGQPVVDYLGAAYPTSTTTDVAGAYTFTNLAVLPAGVHYVVTLDPATVPAGYLPTLTGQGTVATDSSTGSAESVDLTTLGAVDDTLDFGFWVPNPAISIVKKDSNGNDADTDATAVDLGTSPGRASIVYTITNTGTEPLTGVTVTDQVVSNGTVTGLNCTFPDGTTGTVYSGVLAPAATFQCTATLSGVVTGSVDHQDTGFVTGTGQTSKKPVSDQNDYWAKVTKAASVSVGDFVWTDADHNGVQDTGEPGISGVHLSITRTDGKPALNADGSTPADQVTDAAGAYTFTNLAVLPAGVQYTVTLDPATVPAGLFPTLTGQGTLATDSSTGSATSTDLTADGASDPTLDFGFWKPSPAVVIVKKDAAGNDADTAATAAHLSGYPGSTGLVYTITNTGTEPLTGVTVTDQVVSNGTVSGLKCIFPDGSTGTVYAGVLSPGAFFTCTANLSGVVTGSVHNDVATVTGAGQLSKTPVKDDNPYNAVVDKPASVSVGDFVWTDGNHNGVQDTGEPGISGVHLSITRTDGKPALNADGSTPADQVTDAAGAYHFTGLAVLPAGVGYTVTLDPKTVPAGLIPTLTGQGTLATDSSTGSATSTDLTTDGASDPTLDFGFYKPVPGVSIVKGDDKGNAGDTLADSVDLGTANPGSTGLVYTISNTGTEPLTQVTVTDTVVSNGVVTGLTCTFPDGSTGTIWTGPFAVGASFDCTAKLTGVKPGSDHLDTGSATGTGQWSGTPVKDKNDYHAHTTPTKVVQVQLDEYGWGVPAGKPASTKVGSMVAAMDDDDRLAYGEDFFLNPTQPLGSKFGSKRAVIVKVTVPVTATRATLIAAVNKALPAGWAKLTTGNRLAAGGGSGKVTDAWVMPSGASQQMPWGPARTPQTYLGRSVLVTR